MITLNYLPVGTTVRFFDSNHVEIHHFKSVKNQSEYTCPATSSYIGFIYVHCNLDKIRLNNAVIEQPIAISQSLQLNVSELLIPDPIFDNNPRDSERKFPFGWMRDKLITLFQTNQDYSLDTVYVRIMMLASTVEASLRVYLNDDPNDTELQSCPQCGSNLQNFSTIISHLTSNNCSLLQNSLSSNFIINKDILRASLNTIRKARNRLVHRLELTDSDMQEIENEFQPLNQILHDSDRWKRLNLIAVYTYTQLQFVIGEAVAKRASYLQSLGLEEYFSQYMDSDLELISARINFSN